MSFITIGEDSDINVNDIRKVGKITPDEKSGEVYLTIEHVNGQIEQYPFPTVREARDTRNAILRSGNSDFSDRNGKKLETK